MRLVRVADDHYQTQDGRYEVRWLGPRWVVTHPGGGDSKVTIEARTKREAVLRLADMVLSDVTSH